MRIINDTALTGEEKRLLIGMCLRDVNTIRALNALSMPIDVSILREMLRVSAGKDRNKILYFGRVCYFIVLLYCTILYCQRNIELICV